MQVVTYLAGCGLQSCPMLLSKGYPDIGWNPVGGERYLDFLRFAVFVNGQCVTKYICSKYGLSLWTIPEVVDVSYRLFVDHRGERGRER